MTPRPPALDTRAPDAGEALAVALGLACALVVSGAVVLAAGAASRPDAARVGAEPALVALRDADGAAFPSPGADADPTFDADAETTVVAGGGAGATSDAAVAAP